jgi:hypothetical protein
MFEFYKKIRKNEGWGYSSVVEHLPSMQKAQPSSLKKKRGVEGIIVYIALGLLVRFT